MSDCPCPLKELSRLRQLTQRRHLRPNNGHHPQQPPPEHRLVFREARAQSCSVVMSTKGQRGSPRSSLSVVSSAGHGMLGRGSSIVMVTHGKRFRPMLKMKEQVLLAALSTLLDHKARRQELK